MPIVRELGGEKDLAGLQPVHKLETGSTSWSSSFFTTSKRTTTISPPRRLKRMHCMSKMLELHRMYT